MTIQEHEKCKFSDLTVSENIIKITKNNPIKIEENNSYSEKKNESIYIDSKKRIPMYCPNGSDFLDDILNKIKSGKKEYEKKIYDHQDLINTMLYHGILKNKNEINENKKEIKKEYKNKTKKNHISLYLLLSQSCNLGCIYCLNGEDSYCRSKNLQMDEKIAYQSIKRYADEIKKMVLWKLFFLVVNHY